MARVRQSKALCEQYAAIKAEHKDSIILFPVGAFYEVMGEDANIVGAALDLHVGYRNPDAEMKICMCGFPNYRLKTYTEMLLDRGYDVVIVSNKNEKIKTRRIVSQNKEDPISSYPIGRIEYLYANGRVRKQVEFLSPYQFEKDIREESYYGVPFRVVLYQGKDGKSISLKLPKQATTSLRGVVSMPSPYLTNEPYVETPMEETKQSSTNKE